jgi:hypothetical protein
MGNIWVIYGLYILCCACVSVILLRLYLCAFNDTQPHIVVDVLDNPTTRLELYLITLVNSWLAVSMSGADHVVGSELCVFVVHVRVVNVECVSNVCCAHYDKKSFRKSFRKSLMRINQSAVRPSRLVLLLFRNNPHYIHYTAYFVPVWGSLKRNV